MDAAGQTAAQSARNTAVKVRSKNRDMIRDGARREVERRKMEIGMRAPSFPSERESGWVRRGPVS
jgi:hypothetical protein